MPKITISPFAPSGFPKLPPLAGLRLGAMAAGERYRRRADLTLMELAPGSTIAGAFTRSTMPARRCYGAAGTSPGAKPGRL